MTTMGWRAGTLLLLCGCMAGASGDVRAADQATPTVVATYPHDTGAFTQGLLLHEGSFYESTGQYGDSTLRLVDPESGEVQQSIDLTADYFGEGLARVGDTLWQLTWQEETAFRYDIDDFSEIQQASYVTEGWGLCFDGERLVMSDGSGTLFFRDPESFDLLDQIDVDLDGGPVTRLNELECVGELVYANVWQTDDILRIDPSTGEVLTVIDASGLLTPSEAASADVLNGIAYDPGSDRFFLTGKYWPWVFEVEFDFDSGSAGNGGGTDTGDDDDDDTGTPGSTGEPGDDDDDLDESGSAGGSDGSGGDGVQTDGGSDGTGDTAGIDDDPAGCACRATPTGSSAWALMFLALAFRPRRRR